MQIKKENLYIIHNNQFIIFQIILFFFTKS